MKKISILICLITLLLSTNSFAISQDPCATKDVCCEEPAPGPFAFSYPEDNGLSCPRGFHVFGEFLLMKPSEEGLEYAISNQTSASNPWIFPLIVGKVEGFSSGSQEWDWRPGFRIGFGSNSTFDQVDIEGAWTYIKIKANANATINSTGDFSAMFIPTFPDPSLVTVNLKDVSARWSGDFNTFDISCAKPYHISKYYVSSPKFGVRAAWIDQDMTFRYSLISTETSPNLNGIKATAKK